MIKKLTALLLSAVLLLGVLPVTAMAASYTVGNNIVVPNAKVPADGSNPYCDCGKAVGSGSHWCCWNYGHEVFYQIWGVYANRYDNSFHYLRNVAAADRTLTAAHLKQYLQNAAPGALVRMDRDPTPSAGDSNGHTIMFVQMNEAGDGAYFLEGNYDGQGRSRLHEWKFAKLASQYDHYPYIKYILWPNAPAYTPSLVQKTLPSYGIVRATTNTAVKSKACSTQTDPSSVTLDSVAAGETYTVNGLVLTKYDSYWYKTTTPEGKTGYLYAGDVTMDQLLQDAALRDAAAPTELTQGSSYTLQGTVETTYTRLTDVGAWVYPADGTESAALTGLQTAVTANSYALTGSTVDRSTKFGSLTPGGYTYVVRAGWENYYTVSAKQLAADSHHAADLLCAEFRVIEKGHTHSYSMTGDGTHHWEVCACGAESERLPHEEAVDAAVDPTCTVPGLTEGRHCTVCGAVTLAQEELPAAGHHMVAGACTACGETVLTVTAQPRNVTAALGGKVTVSFTAVGEGLTYQWYYADAGAESFTLTKTFTGPEYTVIMSEARAGRRIYCVVTDCHGNTVQTDTVTLSLGLALTKDARSVTVANGKKATVTVAAQGQGLKYAWYYADAGAESFTLTKTFTGPEYTVVMNEARAGRRVYCVITDRNGRSVQTGTATLSMAGVKITRQPVSVDVRKGHLAEVTLEAAGEGLRYVWYYSDNNGGKYYKTAAFTGPTYAVEMTDARAGRLLYCVVTDSSGQKVQSATVTLRMALALTKDAQGVTAAAGEKATVTVAAEGQNLSYRWYYADAGTEKFTLTKTFAGPEYTVAMNDVRAGRRVYCVITDRYGRTVKSTTVTLKMR